MFQMYSNFFICLIYGLSLAHGGAGTLSNKFVDNSCQTDEDCNLFFKGSIAKTMCKAKECICVNNLNEPVSCISKEVLSNEIGGNCPCLIKNSFCNEAKNNTCECKSNFVASDDNKSCILASVQLDENCLIDANCYKSEPFTECSLERKCSCSKGFSQINGTCFSILEKPAKSCKMLLDCANVTNSICLASECGCRSGYVSSKVQNECLPNVKYNQSCQETIQCRRYLNVGGDCINGTCSCRQGFKEKQVNDADKKTNETTCVHEIDIGIDCITTKDCIMENENLKDSLMICHSNQCECRSGYTYDGEMCKKDDAVGASIRNGINVYYLPLLLTIIFIISIH